jgi:hypothetical protein
MSKHCYHKTQCAEHTLCGCSLYMCHYLRAVSVTHMYVYWHLHFLLCTHDRDGGASLEVAKTLLARRESLAAVLVCYNTTQHDCIAYSGASLQHCCDGHHLIRACHNIVL